MTKQKTIGAIIAISLPVIGLIFKLQQLRTSGGSTQNA